MSVVVGGVFNPGLLADPRPDATYDDDTVPAEVLDQAVRMQVACQRYGIPLRAAAPCFPLAHPAVASVLIGARSAEEVRDAVTEARRPVPFAAWWGLRDAGLLPQHVPVPLTGGY